VEEREHSDGNQKQSEAIRSNHTKSEGNQRVIHGNQKQSEAIRSQSVAIRSHQRTTPLRDASES
jgi:hypothetical protein